MSEVHLSRQALRALAQELAGIFGERFRSFLAYDAHVAPGLSSDAARAADSAGDLRGGPGWPERDAGPAANRPDSMLDHAGALHTMAVVEEITFDDLAACALRFTDWTRRGFATPFLISEQEFARSLDAFPLEYGEIIAHHIVIAGRNPFDGLQVNPEDLRRACEVQAKSHLLHLREGYIETGGRPALVAELVAASAAPFSALLRNIARLQDVHARTPDDLARHAGLVMGVSSEVVRQVVAIIRPEDLSPIDAVRLYPAYLETVERLATFVDQWTS
jgi:hypothetical protein